MKIQSYTVKQLPESKPVTASGSLERSVGLPLPIGTNTKRGKISGITCNGGERFYFIDCPGSVVALMPAELVEQSNIKLSDGD